MGPVEDSVRKPEVARRKAAVAPRTAVVAPRFRPGTTPARLPRWIAYVGIGVVGISFYAGAAYLIWAWLTRGI
jgi:hypothetical protein